jgi:predicted ArsR family transcriptional regulator
MDDRWNVVTALSEPSRRALYDYVRRQDHPVGREEAAEATAISRALAAFHLDKLVEVGLLSARYQAPAGQARGRGRTPKVYEATGDGLAVTIPERRYELMADILAEAVAGGEQPAAEAAARLAYRRGRDLSVVVPPGPDVVGALAALGFEPRSGPEAVTLHNCPFHALAARHTALVCGLNHAFLSGLVDGLGVTDATPVLAPHPGRCCVELRAR